MNRKEKIKILQAIREGKINIESLQPPQVYFFIERSDKPGIYEHNGKEYNETEYREFCDKIKRKKNGSLIFSEGRQYPKEDLIIIMRHAENKRGENRDDCLTLNIT